MQEMNMLISQHVTDDGEFLDHSESMWSYRIEIEWFAEQEESVDKRAEYKDVQAINNVLLI